MPLASDPNLDITGFLYRSLEFLRKELSYSGQYKPSSSDSRPDKLDDADKRRSELGLPVTEQPVDLPGISTPGGATGTGSTAAAPGLPDAGGPAGFGGNTGPTGEPVAGSIPGTIRKPERAQPIPGPGTVLGLPNTDASGQYPGNMGFNSAAAVSPVGAADLLSPSFNPGLFGAAAGTDGGATTGRRKRRTKRS